MGNNYNIIGRNCAAREECVAPEPLVVEFKSVARLLNLPVTDSRMRSDFRKKSFDFPSSQFVIASSRVFREEPLNPSDAGGDGFFLGTGSSAYSQVSFLPFRDGVYGSGHEWDGLTNSTVRQGNVPCYF